MPEHSRRDTCDFGLKVFCINIDGVCNDSSETFFSRAKELTTSISDSVSMVRGRDCTEKFWVLQACKRNLFGQCEEG